MQVAPAPFLVETAAGREAGEVMEAKVVVVLAPYPVGKEMGTAVQKEAEGMATAVVESFLRGDTDSAAVGPKRAEVETGLADASTMEDEEATEEKKEVELAPYLAETAVCQGVEVAEAAA